MPKKSSKKVVLLPAHFFKFLQSENNDRFLTFDTITLVPYEKKLIKPEMLEKKHVS